MSSEPVPAVDVREASTREAAGACLLDVREPGEWESGHAPQAAWIPMRDVPGRVDELPSDRPILVICRSGSRSARVTEALVGAGYDAANVAGGMKAWAAAGLPVVTSSGQPGSVA